MIFLSFFIHKKVKSIKCKPYPNVSSINAYFCIVKSAQTRCHGTLHSDQYKVLKPSLKDKHGCVHQIIIRLVL